MKKYLTIIISITLFIAWIGVVPESTALTQNNAQADNPELIFQGRWKTDSGSLYEYNNGAMICIAVQDNKYRGWISQVALKNFQLMDDGWYVEQAIRYHDTGSLSGWMTAKIEILNETTFQKTVIDKSIGQAKCCKPQIWVKVQ